MFYSKSDIKDITGFYLEEKNVCNKKKRHVWFDKAIRAVLCKITYSLP